MTKRPGLSFQNVESIAPDIWIINEFNHLDNFKVCSIKREPWGRGEQCVVKGLFQGSDVEQVRNYHPDDILLTADFNPMVSFVSNDKTSEQLAFDIKMMASTATPPPANIDYLCIFNPSLNLVGKVNFRLSDHANGIYSVNFRNKDGVEETQVWNAKDCLYMNDKPRRTHGLPVNGTALQLRNATDACLNRLLTQENIDKFVELQAIVVAAGGAIRSVEVKTSHIRIEGDDKQKNSFIFSVELDGKIDLYSFKSKIKDVARLIIDNESGLIPNEKLGDIMNKHGLELADNHDLRYINKNAGYHYNSDLDDESTGLSKTATIICDKLKEVFQVEKVGREIDNEYGHVDFDLADCIPLNTKGGIITEHESCVFVKNEDWVKFQWSSEVPDFSIRPAAVKYSEHIFDNKNEGDLEKLIDLNMRCLYNIEKKIHTIKADRIFAFSKAERIQGTHLNNFGIENLKVAYNSIDNLIDQTKKAGVIKVNDGTVEMEI